MELYCRLCAGRSFRCPAPGNHAYAVCRGRLGALLYFVSKGMDDGGSLWIAGSMSYGLHLLADSLTQRGITPLPPLPVKLRLKLMSTGTKKGNAVEKVCVMLTLALVVYVFVLTPSLV